MLKTDHPWIKEDGEAPDKPLDNAVLNRLKQFRAMNQFKKVALRVLVIICFILMKKFSWNLACLKYTKLRQVISVI